MRVKYSNNVRLTIQQYASSLKRYPISPKRRNEKVRKLRSFLRIKIRMISETVGCNSYPLCRFADLGQVFNQNEMPLNQYLRQTNFSDESGTQWLISFMLLENNTIFIQELKQAKNIVKESLVINESLLRSIIHESIGKVLQESYITRRLGKYTVVNGDKKPHSVAGLEKYGNNLYDIAMYSYQDEHLCVFSVGKDSNKFICCSLEYDKDYKEWLGFTPIKYYEVPTLIRQDIKEHFTNS